MKNKWINKYKAMDPQKERDEISCAGGLADI